ncbi:hypothetical protein BC833DRAFT_626446 [Globomyces pollinis-pini]|nr:hypothetical protein BC833DRAFT_626446 [Globomyces pollinis-pini]KAJ2984895.1 hypothetical protein HDV02_000866 [Globomyces sp. JEL0801]
MNNILYKHIEIVGLDEGSNGRICGIHPENCGSQLVVGNQVKIRKSRIQKIVTTMKEVIIPEPTPVIKKRGRPKDSKKELQEIIEVKTVDTYKVFVWKNGSEGYLIGFVSEVFINFFKEQLDGRTVGINDICNVSESESIRRRSKENNGMALGAIIG